MQPRSEVVVGWVVSNVALTTHAVVALHDRSDETVGATASHEVPRTHTVNKWHLAQAADPLAGQYDVVGSHGLSVGEIVGDVEGIEVVGDSVGWLEVGKTVGMVVGAEVGDPVGDLVGCDLVGVAVGEALGSRVGPGLDGDVEGDSVGGEVVGCVVGDADGSHVLSVQFINVAPGRYRDTAQPEFPNDPIL